MDWMKEMKTLRDGDRHSLQQDGAVRELQIRDLAAEDAGEYLYVCKEERISAMLIIVGKDHRWPSKIMSPCPSIDLMPQRHSPSFIPDL